MRIGTAEIYRVVEDIDGITDSLIVHLEREDTLILFVVAETGADRDLVSEIRQALSGALSPRHVPNEFYVVDAIPTTLSGKKLEVPVKRILAGDDPEVVASRGSLRDPAALDRIVAIARARRPAP